MITLLPAARAQGTNANLDRAQALLAAHNYGQAAEAFTAVIAAAPDNSAAYHGRGMARINQNDYAGAIMDFDRALALDPGDAIGFNERGYAKMRMGDLKGALPDYDRCIALNPNYAPVHTNRGMMLRNSGNTQGAILDFNRALAIAPNNERALTERASLRLSLGDAAGALADDSAIIAVDPEEFWRALQPGSRARKVGRPGRSRGGLSRRPRPESGNGRGQGARGGPASLGRRGGRQRAEPGSGQPASGVFSATHKTAGIAGFRKHRARLAPAKPGAVVTILARVLTGRTRGKLPSAGSLHGLCRGPALRAAAGDAGRALAL